LQSAMIWVDGEALIDLLPGTDSQVPIVGGGPANTAIALANLGLPVSFVGGISSDCFGSLIAEELSSFGVDLGLVNRSDLPSALAVVSLDSNGLATYTFSLDKTATFDFGNWLPDGSPSVLHVGSLATVVEPGASELLKWASKLDTFIVFDPNVRSNVLNERDVYRAYFELWAKISDVVKLSDEDLSWLGYSVEEIIDFGVELVVLTHGAKGLSGFRRGESIFVEGVSVEVVDTVGAGDTVGAVLVEGLVNHGKLVGKNLKFVLERAATAAAITCTSAGAKPPNLVELNGGI
jgi:fructokinase